MYNLFSQWASSLKHIFSLLFIKEVMQIVAYASPCIFGSIATMCLAVMLSCMDVPYISLFLRAIFFFTPPLVALLGSPLYVPFLIYKVQSRYGLPSSRLASMGWSLFLYGIILCFGLFIDAVIFYGSPLVIVITTSLVLLFFIVFLRKIVALPIASIALLFKPMSERSYRVVWRHAERMMWHELAGVLVLFSAMIPFVYGVYCGIQFLVVSYYITPYAAYCLLHGINIVCWQISWIACMVFYQQRKRAYIE